MQTWREIACVSLVGVWLAFTLLVFKMIESVVWLETLLKMLKLAPEVTEQKPRKYL